MRARASRVTSRARNGQTKLYLRDECFERLSAHQLHELILRFGAPVGSDQRPPRNHSLAIKNETENCTRVREPRTSGGATLKQAEPARFEQN